MNPRHAVITSRATAEIVSLLFATARRSLHVREIARRCGLSEAMMRRELRRLAGIGLVEARHDGNRLCYRARMTHPLASDLQSMVSKSVGIVEALRMALREPKVDLVIAHGPGGAELPSPRVFVIGTERQLAAALARGEREVNPDIGGSLGGNAQRRRSLRT